MSFFRSKAVDVFKHRSTHRFVTLKVECLRCSIPHSFHSQHHNCMLSPCCLTVSQQNGLLTSLMATGFFNDTPTRSSVRTTRKIIAWHDAWEWGMTFLAIAVQLTYKSILSLGQRTRVNKKIDHWIRINLDIKDKIMSIIRWMDESMKSHKANSV